MATRHNKDIDEDTTVAKLDVPWELKQDIAALLDPEAAANMDKGEFKDTGKIKTFLKSLTIAGLSLAFQEWKKTKYNPLTDLFLKYGLKIEDLFRQLIKPPQPRTSAAPV